MSYIEKYAKFISKQAKDSENSTLAHVSEASASDYMTLAGAVARAGNINMKKEIGKVQSDIVAGKKFPEPNKSLDSPSTTAAKLSAIGQAGNIDAVGEIKKATKNLVAGKYEKKPAPSKSIVSNASKAPTNEETVTLTRQELANLIEAAIANYLVSEGIDIQYKDPKTGEWISGRNSTNVPKQQGTLSDTLKKKDKELPKPEPKNAFTKPQLEI